MGPLFQAIVSHTPVPDVDTDGPLLLQISALDYSSYTGVIGIGRVFARYYQTLAKCYGCCPGRNYPQSQSPPALWFHGT